MKCKKFVGWSRLLWYNFVKVGNNWLKICNLVYKGTYNRCVKNWLKIPNRLGKIVRKPQGEDFFDSHRAVVWYCCHWDVLQGVTTGNNMSYNPILTTTRVYYGVSHHDPVLSHYMRHCCEDCLVFCWDLVTWVGSTLWLAGAVLLTAGAASQLSQFASWSAGSSAAVLWAVVSRTCWKVEDVNDDIGDTSTADWHRKGST